MSNHSNKTVKNLIEEGASAFAFKANIPDGVDPAERKRMLRVIEQEFLDAMTDGKGIDAGNVLNSIRPRSLEKFNHAIQNGCKSIKAN